MTNMYASRSLDTEESAIAITPTCVVPASRASEWAAGTRPLDGMDASFYFKMNVERGLYPAERALELHQRHLRLTRQEAAASSGALACKACYGAPPPGFTCRSCGAEA